MVKLYYIVSLHQTTTVVFISFTFLSCIISFLYIKPQLVIVMLPLTIVVLYRFSTSNHNSMVLFVILILLYYIVSLHQTTTDNQFIPRWESCIISFLYIKPQLVPNTPQCLPVVLYRFSTSNHNTQAFGTIYHMLYYIVSLHQTTTFNLDLINGKKLYYIVSLHQTTTTLSLVQNLTKLYYIVSLHQTTTTRNKYIIPALLYYIVSLHQTTTVNLCTIPVLWLYYIVSLHQTTTGIV